MPQTLEPVLGAHPFFSGLRSSYLQLIAGCAVSVAFDDGKFLFREGRPADAFFLILAGGITLEVTAGGTGSHVVQTLGAGDVAGFSWLIQPHRWQFDGRAAGPVRAVQLDGPCVRRYCDADPQLGYELMRRFAALASARLQATRLQLMDVYGNARR
jgi:CRP/FNR family transcriptional regulator, cyclic AMP receptor protein